MPCWLKIPTFTKNIIRSNKFGTSHGLSTVRINIYRVVAGYLKGTHRLMVLRTDDQEILLTKILIRNTPSKCPSLRKQQIDLA